MTRVGVFPAASVFNAFTSEGVQGVPVFLVDFVAIVFLSEILRRG
jgi:hypothetical protein